jgi:3,4-dihydroxy 2-butanone 4-phosphate synthase/GTP cyclohydrolase II
MKVATETKKLKGAPMDLRHIGTGAQIIRALGVVKMRIHTSSQRPIKGINGFGLEIVGREVFGEE